MKNDDAGFSGMSPRLKALDPRVDKLDPKVNEYTHNDRLQELDEKSRRQQVVDLDKRLKEEAEAEKKNQDFFMFFKKTGSPVFRKLMAASPIAARLFLFLAESADRTNAIVASGRALAAATGASEPSISRAIKTLVDGKLIERLKTGGSNVFILNPEIIWSSWATGKDYCMFGNAKVLVSKGEQDLVMQKRLTVMLEKTKAKSLEHIDEDGVITNTQAALEAAGQQRLDVDVEQPKTRKKRVAKAG